MKIFQKVYKKRVMKTGFEAMFEQNKFTHKLIQIN